MVKLQTDSNDQFLNNKKALLLLTELFRGLVRIRTGVDGFADRCLTARPRDRFLGEQKY